MIRSGGAGYPGGRAGGDDRHRGLAAGFAGAGALGGVGEGREIEEGLSRLGDGLGLDQLVAQGAEAADRFEAGLRPGRRGPGLEFEHVDLEVLGDVDQALVGFG
ncbi:MAG TPA: hypothetical protein VFF69_06735, partial [Phycisphaerales bacterium]|nr:hypothetical protein [Phycisphaerales bacterium]